MTSENDSSPMTPAMTPGELEQALLEDPHIINAMVHDKITLDGSIRVGTIANNYCKREAVTFRLEPYNCWLSPRSIHAGHYQHFTVSEKTSPPLDPGLTCVQIKSPLFDMLLAEEKYFDIRSLLVATDTEQQAAGEEGVLCLSRLVGHILNARRWHAEVEDATEADRAPEVSDGFCSPSSQSSHWQVICLSFPQHHVKATPPRTRNGSRVFLPSAQGEELAQRHAPALATHPEVKARKTTAATAEFLNAHGPLLSNDRTHTMVKVEYEVGGVHDESPVVQRARQVSSETCCSVGEC